MIRPCIFAAFALALAAPAAAETQAKDIAARSELHSIHTLTLSDKQFLTGDSDAKAATVSGQLRLPVGTGRLPVVVLMHGSGGMGPNVEMWAREYNAMGIATFALDGFTGRGRFCSVRTCHSCCATLPAQSLMAWIVGTSSHNRSNVSFG